MEQIGIRECARRLGVSDTAVHKAIKSGRVTIVGRTASSNRPLVGWPQAHAEWLANTNEASRTHIGANATVAASVKPPPVMKPRNPPAAVAGSKPKDKPAKPEKPAKPDRPKAHVPREAPPPADILPPPSAPQQPEAPTGPTYAQSRAIREAYQARLARLDYEERTGKLVSNDQVKAAWFKQITAAKTRLLGVSAECKTRVPDLPLTVLATIDMVVREALEDLAGER